MHLSTDYFVHSVEQRKSWPSLSCLSGLFCLLSKDVLLPTHICRHAEHTCDLSMSHSIVHLLCMRTIIYSFYTVKM